MRQASPARTGRWKTSFGRMVTRPPGGIAFMSTTSPTMATLTRRPTKCPFMERRPSARNHRQDFVRRPGAPCVSVQRERREFGMERPAASHSPRRAADGLLVRRCWDCCSRLIVAALGQAAYFSGAYYQRAISAARLRVFCWSCMGRTGRVCWRARRGSLYSAC